MKTKGTVKAAVVCLALLSLGLVWGPALAANKPAPLTLDQTVEMALGYSPNLEATRQQVQDAMLGEKEAFTYYLPSLDTSYAYRRQDEPSRVNIGGMSFQTGAKNTYQWSTTLSQPLFTGMRITGNYRLAQLGVNLAEMNLHLGKLDVAVAAKEAYLQYLKAQKSLSVARESVRQLEAHLKTSKDFHEVGIIPINDVLKVEVELANAKQNEVRAENGVALSRASLATLLGLGADAEFEVEDILRPHKIPLTYDQAKNRARVERPELKALGIQLKQADENITVAQSDYYPQLKLQGGYNATSDSPELGDSDYYDPSSWQVNAVMEWNLWQWGRTNHQVGRARVAKKRLDAVRKDLEDQIDLQVKQAYLFLLESEKNIVTASTAVTQAKENFRITDERFKEQLTTNTEVLDAQFLLTQAQENYFTALTTFNLAGAKLQRAMGLGLEPSNIRQNK